MKKAFTFVFKAGLVLVLLAAAAAALAPLLLERSLPPEKVRALVAQKAAESLHRQVRLGEVSYSLVHGLTLSDVAVSERPDFAAGTFLAAKSVHARLQWRPLLQKRIALESVAADGLSASVSKSASGAYNFSDLQSTAPAAASSAPGFDFDIAKVSLADGRLSYRDEASGAQWNISKLNARLAHVRSAGPMDVEVSLEAAGVVGGKPAAGRLAYSGSVDPAGEASIRKLVVESAGRKAELSGTLSDFSTPKLDVDFSLSRNGVKEAGGHFAGLVTPSPFGVAGEVEAETPGFALAKMLSLPAFKAKGRFDYAADRVELSRLRVEGGFGSLEASGSVAGLSGAPVPDLDFAAELALPALTSAQAPWARLPPGLSVPPLAVSGKGHVTGDSLRLDALRLSAPQGVVDIAGTAQRLSSGRPALDLAVSAKLDLPAIRSEDLAWANLPAGYVSPAMAVAGKVRLKGDDLSISELHVKAKAGTTDVSGTIRGLTSAAPRPDLNVRAQVDLPPLKSADLPLRSIPAGLEIPATKWDLDASGTLDEVRIRHLRLIAGKNDIEVADGHVSGLRSGTPLFSVLFKCRSFDLAQLTSFSPATRDAGLSGSGFFALEVTGKWPKPILAGKLKFQGLGGTVGGLKLADFAGIASFDERRIDVPNLSGKVEGGTLDMDLTVKDYASKPAVDLEASLDRFDLGAFLKAKAAVSQGPSEASSKPSQPIALKGKLTVGQLVHPAAQASNVQLAWDLDGVAPDLSRLSGTAQFRVAGGGRISSLGDMAEQSVLVKILVAPLLAIQKIGRLGGARVFPDFNNVRFSDAAGDYAFQDGAMDVRNMHLVSDAGAVSAKGRIDLPRQTLDLAVTAQVTSVAPIGVDVTGTFDRPKTRVQLAKFLLGRQQDVETSAPVDQPR